MGLHPSYLARGAFVPVLHDTNMLSETAYGIYVGGAGDLKILTERGDIVTYKAVPVGKTLWVSAKQIFSTGTTATFLIGYTH